MRARGEPTCDTNDACVLQATECNEKIVEIDKGLQEGTGEANENAVAAAASSGRNGPPSREGETANADVSSAANIDDESSKMMEQTRGKKELTPTAPVWTPSGVSETAPEDVRTLEDGDSTTALGEVAASVEPAGDSKIANQVSRSDDPTPPVSSCESRDKEGPQQDPASCGTKAAS